MLIGAGDAPVAVGGERRPVLKTGAAPAGGRADLLDHQPRGTELGEVLADRVVVELEARRQGGHVDGAGGIGDGAEDGVAGGITERLGLALDVPIPIGYIAPTSGRTHTHTRPYF